MKTIGKVAQELGISVETIRFYEQKGLIKQPIKPVTGYRLYTEEIVNRLRFILKAKELGFTLNEIGSLMKLSQNCHAVEELGLAKLAVIRAKIASLKKLEAVISKLTEDCRNTDENQACPIINSLSKH